MRHANTRVRTTGARVRARKLGVRATFTGTKPCVLDILILCVCTPRMVSENANLNDLTCTNSGRKQRTSFGTFGDAYFREPQDGMIPFAPATLVVRSFCGADHDSTGRR